jgi:glycerol uptake facilitator-like aquaporin
MPTNADYLAQFLVELVGTFIFLVVVISTGNPIAIGLVLIGLIFFALWISGGYFNPAITLLGFLNNSLDGTQFVLFLIAQFCGGILAYLFYYYFLKSKIETSKANNNNYGITLIV